MRPLVLAVLAAAVLPAAPAAADKVTLGSDLRSDATIVEARQADVAFWLTSVRGSSPAVPADGQVLSATVKGTVLSEPGAAAPSTLFHLQALSPPGPDGSAKVHLTSQAFHMPVDRPNALTTFRPENLCIEKGGLVAFNEIGGFHFGGSLDAALDPAHYESGAPFQIFGSVPGSTTAFYSANDGTNNGATLSPNPPSGGHRAGEELLMQVVVATGDDRSYECGGPLRRSDGSIYVPPKARDPYIKLVAGQRPYVPRSRRTRLGVYCSGPVPCEGVARIFHKHKRIAAKRFRFAGKGSGFISLRISRRGYRMLRHTKHDRLRVRIRLVMKNGLDNVTARTVIRR
jgi:hypothetical protein